MNVAATPVLESASDIKTFCDLGWEIYERIAAFLPSNEVACTVRLISKSMASLFRGYRSVQLSEPVPHHAFLSHWSRPEALHNLTLKQRRQLLDLTARSGCLDNLQVASTAAGCPLTEEVLIVAAGSGHLDMCLWLLQRKCPCGPDAVAAAARAGHPAVAVLLLHEGMRASFQAWAAAAGAGHWAVCERLLADGMPCDARAPIAAARGGHVGLTHWLLQLPEIQLPRGSSLVIFQTELLEAAAYGFELAALQQLHQALRLQRPAAAAAGHDGDNDDDNGDYDRIDSSLQGNAGGALLAAALASPIPDWRAKVQWLQAQRCVIRDEDGIRLQEPEVLVRLPDCVERLDLLLRPHQQEGFLLQKTRTATDVLYAAIGAGNLSLVRYLREGRPWLPAHATRAAERAAEAGDLAILEELVALGWSINSSVVEAAVEGGHLHVLRWLEGPVAGPAGRVALRAAMGPWLARVAAESGSSLELLVWLRERGCRWSEWTFVTAAGAGCPAVVEGLVARGCPMPEAGEPYLSAVRNGDLVMLRCLRQLGCPWGPRCDTLNQQALTDRGVGSVCSPEVLRWLAAEGLQGHPEAAAPAGGCGDPDVGREPDAEEGR
ncbi:hypothetical protein PLESTB_000012400 [Pleodorina starrii]|uniref:Ankyrin repeat domain-containing protein n=1 Tax=Pleodorina starrii TaxID=330485 RepID=A0A9W6B891_9CHLO|nr:hypothetical protein PLESTM_001122400 [Pleodorina starrii]GLC47658.1 hypothetical protein PLESTB_000012400 [Pleodorina starrii]GLC70930.1 hypothetical protein PLESTF_001047800 [Pleodorina starrii]